MTNFTKNDIETFGRVLAGIGIAIERNPSILMDLLNTNTSLNKFEKEKEHVRDQIKTLNIFDEFKDKKKSEIENELLTYTKDELKFIVKNFSLGATRLNSVEKLSDFIADQVSKRTKDVFIKQE
ncbi:hypothetical protein [Aeromonas molluscorum]|uniref:hypothetical protein n=1 Tax=Aeromonas molluscorum TaxID=271417 RepID=UPI003F1BA146